MAFRSDIERVCIVGSGLIGSGWAARCLAHGLEVVASDPGPGAEATLRANVENAWPALAQTGLAPGASIARLSFEADLAAAVAGADFVQENGPDNIDVKRRIHLAIAAAAAPDVIIASSSSGLLPSEIQEDCDHPERIIIGHPFNPVYILPLVETLGGAKTDPAALDTADGFYRAIGMQVLRVRKEVDGYISDRLQEAMWREALHMVAEGTATTGEIDDAIVYGPGLRLAIMGPCLTFHLAGGETGMRHMLEQFGPALELPWTKLKAPALTEQLIDRMVEGTRASAGARSVKELEALRDKCLISIMESLKDYDYAAGQVLAANQARLKER